MHFSHLLAAVLVLTSVTLAQPVAHVSPSAEKAARGWSNLPLDAQHAIRSALEADNPGWTQQAELRASDAANGDYFGMEVAISGNTVVVGAPMHAGSSNQSAGMAYVFVKNGETWSQQAELSAPDGETGDEFGISIAIEGSTIVVGAPCHAASGPNCGSGAAYVFVLSGGTWIQQAEMTASDGAAGDQFGHSVAISGTTIVVGTPYHTVTPHYEQGWCTCSYKTPPGHGISKQS